MSDLKKLIKYIETLEAEPFTGWTGENKKGYLTACTSIKKKAERLLLSDSYEEPTLKEVKCWNCGVIIGIYGCNICGAE